MDCNPPGLVHGISQAMILQWVAIAFSRSTPHLRIELRSRELGADSVLSAASLVAEHRSRCFRASRVLVWHSIVRLLDSNSCGAQVASSWTRD